MSLILSKLKLMKREECWCLDILSGQTKSSVKTKIIESLHMKPAGNKRRGEVHAQESLKVEGYFYGSLIIGSRENEHNERIGSLRKHFKEIEVNKVFEEHITNALIFRLTLKNLSNVANLKIRRQ
ncbi:unnamed protein product [Allacma fusca]|uniref:Uncharacterized protein n=1 Tax=Allacma fusca TaxID=39272 RepID=A0A8J2L4U1_9HEXA|nr:unnamed protein product [Allacma fusca]